MIVVAGLNGSGTSAMVKVLDELGVPFGEYTDDVGWWDGPTRENRLAMAANNRILRLLTAIPACGPLRIEQIPDYDAIRGISPAEVEFFPAGMNWKNPKVMLTLPVWRHKNPRLIYVMRNPGHVMSNLLGHHPYFDEPELRQVIKKYQESFERAIEEFELPVHVIEYEALYQDKDVTAVRRMMDYCGANGREDVEIAAVLDNLKQPKNQ